MTGSCRICLGESSQFNLLSEKICLISYLEMLTTLVVDIGIQEDDVLCATCCSELVCSYNFLKKVRTNNKTFSEQSCEWKLENVKDPLEEESCAECPQKGVFGDFKFDLPKFEDFNNHVNEESKEKPILCDTNFDEDSYSEKWDDNLLLNNLSDLSVSPENVIFPRGPFKCHFCEKSYFTSTGLKAHHDVHLPKTPSTKKKRSRRLNKQTFPKDTSDTESTPANLCSEVDPNKDLEKIKKEKQLKPKKTFPCQVCGKEMISASKLRYHLVMHTGEKDFLCSMCPKAYSTIYALKHHFRSHSGYRPYECKFCGDRFYRTTTLKSHVRRHTGERPYGCEICGKRFIQHSSMTTHIKLNHMSKTIPCPHCDKKYARQTDLNTHLLSHTGDKPFSCQLCPSRFVRQANLNKHMKQQHFGTLSQTNARSEKSIEENIETNVKLINDQIVPINENNSTN